MNSEPQNLSNVPDQPKGFLQYFNANSATSSPLDPGRIFAFHPLSTCQPRTDDLIKHTGIHETAYGVLNAFFCSSPAGLAVFDNELRYVRINDTLAEINGVPISGHIGRRVSEVLPEMGSSIERSLRSVVRTGKPETNLELTGTTPRQPGAIRSWVCTLSPIRDPQARIIGVGAVVVEITERKKAEQALTESRDQLRALATHMDNVREEERTHMAREIHDILGRSLTVLKMDLDWIREHAPQSTDSAVNARFEEMTSCVEEIHGLVRQVVHDLHPSILDELGLVAALQWTTRQFQSRTGIGCFFYTQFEDLKLTPQAAIAVFRIVQEAHDERRASLRRQTHSRRPVPPRIVHIRHHRRQWRRL